MTVRVPKAAELVAGELRKRIIRGIKKQGEMLEPEAKLLEQFDVSRPTMREAIRILESEGLITINRGARKGAVVQLPTAHMVAKYTGFYLQSHQATLLEIIEARILLEPPAARMVAQKRDPLVIQDLENLLDQIRENGEGEQFSYLLMEFRGRILDGTDNQAISVLGRALLEIGRNHVAQLGTAYRGDTVRAALRSGKALVELIRTGDAEGAERHTWKQLANARRVVRRDLDDRTTIEILQ